MGLDWCLQPKSRENDKDKEEFYRLKYQLKLHRDMLYKAENQGTEENDELEQKTNELEEKFNIISIQPSDSINNLSDDDIVKLNNCLIGGSFVSDDCDFRGKVIGQSDILSEELKNEAYEHHSSEQCIEYAIKLEIFIETLNKEDLTEDEQEDYDFIVKAINWLKFWGKLGHGYYAWY